MCVVVMMAMYTLFKEHIFVDHYHYTYWKCMLKILKSAKLLHERQKNIIKLKPCV